MTSSVVLSVVTAIVQPPVRSAAGTNLPESCSRGTVTVTTTVIGAGTTVSVTVTGGVVSVIVTVLVRVRTSVEVRPGVVTVTTRLLTTGTVRS